MSSTIIDHALKKFAEDWSCHHCQISRGLPKERTTSHKHCPWPPRPCLSCLRSDKASSILSMECIPFNDNAAFWPSLGLYLNLSIFILSINVFFFYPGNTLFNELIHCYHVSVNLIFKFSLMWVQAFAAYQPSTGFLYDLQELTSYTYFIHSPKHMQIEWVHQIDYCVHKTAITCACINLPISVHNDRHFSANGFVTI